MNTDRSLRTIIAAAVALDESDRTYAVYDYTEDVHATTSCYHIIYPEYGGGVTVWLNDNDLRADLWRGWANTGEELVELLNSHADLTGPRRGPGNIPT